MRDACRRFAAAVPHHSLLAPLPRAALRVAALASPQANYLRDLLACTTAHAGTYEAGETARLLGPCNTTIEQYAQSIDATGDWPSK